ncbi:hypothetical protein LX97_00808 [Nonlabens dokdonensis]|uniref:Uncharacterized protein n=2 Tax=Nonlabens dokdonensis TaxID=328515 RepID=L7W7F0_NONDD|nr:hypothetical protein [Nonlabens dokdonensis]AGC76132.1 hypothetical protein DDD_1005 [Nonlabens dokdonensis DSW-6]PZX43803.1 hypothetical protein LX97_00808 [Nonlabens dokdonensis]
MILEAYYKRPLLYDYLLAGIVCAGVLFIRKQGLLLIPKTELINQIASDLATIGITISGFILTIMTLFITMKSSQILEKRILTEQSSAFEIWLRSPMYETSIKIIKYGVFSLLAVSITLYVLQLFIVDKYENIIFYFDILILILIFTTFLRCFYVLDLILKMQQRPPVDFDN